jgi:predicted permease
VGDTLRFDLRYALKSLRRDPGATSFIILIAGLGIGASTIVFSLLHALLLRPMPFQDPDRLVWIANGASENLSAQTVQVSNLEALLQQSRSYEGVAGFFPFYAPGDIRLTGIGEPERLTGVPVTQAFFPLLGITPHAGRWFDETESTLGAPKTAVLDFVFWQRRFAGDPAIVGQAINLDGSPVTVIGVLPESFDFGATLTPGRRADLFTAFPLSPETNRQGNTLALIGRLRDDVDLATAQAEATLIGSRIESGSSDGGWRNAFTPRLSTLRDRVSGKFESALYLLAGSVGFLMLLVCANLSNLLLVRASRRQRELAVRSALGASPRRLVRQLLVESLVLCGGGAALGLVLAVAGTTLIAGIQGTTIPLLRDVRVDGSVLAFTALAATGAGLLFGLLPALHATALAAPIGLSEGSRGSTSGRSNVVRRMIVVSEIALVCVLLTGAGLLTRSLGRVLDVDPGFATDNLVAVRVDPSRAQTTAAQRVAWFDEVRRAVATVPGVEAFGLTDALPLGDNFGWRRWGADATDQPEDRDRDVEPLVRMVDAGYLETMGIPLRAGRGFTPADDATGEPVTIINEALANTLWPGLDPVGRSISTGGRVRRVVGVAAGARYFGLDRDVEAEMYMPLGQPGGYSSVDLVVRGTAPQATLIASIRSALQRVDPNLPLAGFRTMRELVDHSVFARRIVVRLVAGFAAFGLVLAALGIYAVIAYSVSQRTQEIGSRMALGETATGLRSRILRETGGLVALGVLLGLPLAWMSGRAIRGLLYDTGASDPVTFVGVLALLALVAGLAGYLPARRASQVDPAVALRPD